MTGKSTQIKGKLIKYFVNLTQIEVMRIRIRVTFSQFPATVQLITSLHYGTIHVELQYRQHSNARQS